MFDQAGMVRELVKWDYELRTPDQIGDVVARAVEVAMAHPRGPVYLVLPREPLSAPLAEPIAPMKPRAAGRARSSRSEGDRDAGRMDRGGRAAADHRRHAYPPTRCRRWRISPSAAPFRSSRIIRARVCLPSSHPMHFGFEPGALLADADLVIALESDVPWIPHLQHPPAGCRVAHVGEDPFFVRYPMRSFPSDLAVQAGAINALEALIEAVESRLQMAEARIAARRARLTERMRTRRAQLAKDSGGRRDASRRNICRASSARRVGADAIIFNEYPLRPDHCAREKPGTFFALGPAGGLGWGFGAALGAKLAAPDAFVVATLGDGAYMFSNPTVGHWVAADARPADPHHRVQQQPLRRRAPRDAVDVQGRRRRRERWPHARRSRSGAALRGDRARAGRTCRARRKAGRLARRAGARPRCRGQRRRQALLNVITPY